MIYLCRNTPQCRYMAVYIFNCNICSSLSFYPCTLILYRAPCGLPVFVNTQHGGKVLLLYPVMLLGSKPAIVKILYKLNFTIFHHGDW